MNALVTIETLTPAVVFADGGVESIISKLEAEVRSITTDISTDSGRKSIASLAYKVARSKTALDDMGKELVSDLKAKAGKIDAERRVIRERLDALKDEVRKPLTDWENAEKDRVAAHEAALLAIVESPEYGRTETASELSARLNYLRNYPSREWQEFSERAAATLKGEIARTVDLLATAERLEAERAELERLRAEQAAREKQEREERIAREAAERARAEAEAKAKREADEAATKAEAERRRVEKEKADAIARAERAEAERKAAAERAEREKVAAVEAERKRAADAAAKEAAQAAAREADTKHRASVNRAAVAALVAGGLSDEAAKLAITLIAKREVPAVSISY